MTSLLDDIYLVMRHRPAYGATLENIKVYEFNHVVKKLIDDLKSDHKAQSGDSNTKTPNMADHANKMMKGVKMPSMKLPR